MQATQLHYTVGQIAERWWLMGIRCANGHGAAWRAPDLLERFPPGVTSGQIAERLVCSVCGTREGRVDFWQDLSRDARLATARKDVGLPGSYS